MKIVNQLRILQFITPAGFYGAERWVLALANNFASDSIVCDLAVTEEGPEQDLSVAKYYPKQAGDVHYIPMKSRFDFGAVNQLVRIIKDRNIDIIHTHGYKSDILGIVAAKRAGIKCVSTPHGFAKNAGIKLALFIFFGNVMLRFFDAVVPLSDELMRDMERLKIPKRKTHFIRNGVDLRDIDETLNQIEKHQDSTTNTKDTKYIGFIGQLIPRKGIPDLIEVFDMLHASDKSLKLLLIGDGQQRQELESMVATKKSHANIEFLGFRQDRLELLNQFDLFVMTSSLEGIPRCMMEAMAVGVPVVAYDIPGVDQLIEHEVTGLLAPLGDKEALRAQCERILTNTELAEQLAKAARAKVDEKYSAARMAKEYVAIYEQLLGDGTLAVNRNNRG